MLYGQFNKVIYEIERIILLVPVSTHIPYRNALSNIMTTQRNCKTKHSQSTSVSWKCQLKQAEQSSILQDQSPTFCLLQPGASFIATLIVPESYFA